VTAALLIALAALAQDPLPGVLTQMDRNAASFKSATANLKQINHNAAVDVDNVASGTIKLKRPKPHEMKALINFTDPDPKQVSFQGDVADVYMPKIQTVQEYQVGPKNKALFEQFYLLGFGGSGKDLANAYNVSYVGSETVNGVNTNHLLLVPKSPEAVKSVPKIDLWLDPKAYPAQLKITQAAGDTIALVYTNLKVNPPLSDSDLKLSAPKGVRKEYPGK
jgi:outer membrane lipoprotein-sorting protein